MSEAQKPVTDDYREGWERIFGQDLMAGWENGREAFKARQQRGLDEAIEHIRAAFPAADLTPGEREMLARLKAVNPNDAHEHPKAD
jgi:hypothetical protein